MRDLDEHIFEGMKEEMADFQLNVEDHVWAAVESELGLNERKKRAVWWWWILAGTFIAIVSWWLFAAISYEDIPKSTPITSKPNRVEQIGFPKQKNSVQKPKKKDIEFATVWKEVDGGSRSANQSQSISQTSKNTQSSISGLDDRKVVELSFIDNKKSESVPKIERMDEQKLVIDSTKGPVFDSLIIETRQAPEDKAINIQPIKRKRRWSLLAYGAAGISYRTLSGNQAQSLVDHRNTHESRGLSINAGLAANIDISSKLFVRAGLAYAEYQEKYSFHHDVISHETVNDYKYLHLTASVGTVLFGKGRSKFAILGGPKIGRLLNAQSSWVDPSSLNAVAHSSGQNNQPFQVWTVALNATLEYQLAFTSRITGHAQLALDGNLNSTYKKSTLLTQRPYALLFGLGVRYSF